MAKLILDEPQVPVDVAEPLADQCRTQPRTENLVLTTGRTSSSCGSSKPEAANGNTPFLQSSAQTSLAGFN